MDAQSSINGRAPFGYAWQDGELIEVKAEQAILNTISLLKESGLSYAQIKKQLVARGKLPSSRSPLGWKHGQEIDEVEQEFISIVGSYERLGLSHEQIAQKLTDARFTSRTGPAEFTPRMVKRIMDQRDKNAVTILKELKRLILLSIDEHGQEMHDHSAQLLDHIERTLREIRGGDHDND
tara:strand:+ start:667 stop:1206 length:540 start_codon:yes stop_codon:yes gene_type:complete